MISACIQIGRGHRGPRRAGRARERPAGGPGDGGGPGAADALRRLDAARPAAAHGRPAYGFAAAATGDGDLARWRLRPLGADPAAAYRAAAEYVLAAFAASRYASKTMQKTRMCSRGSNRFSANTNSTRYPCGIIIDKEGKIKHIHFLSAVPDQAKVITDALGQWRFKPYRQNGRAVEVETGLMFGRTQHPSASSGEPVTE